MPENKRPNYFARLLAIAALLGAFALVIFTIATNGDSSSGGKEKSGEASAAGPTKKGEKAVSEGVWVVEEGNSLVQISEETGIDLDELVALNPDIDPQALVPGQRISLRAGSTGGTDGEAGTTTSADPAAEFGDGSVADDSSTP